jgi:hypothetical protein
MTKEQEMLAELELLRKQNEEKDQMISDLHKDNEELNLVLKAQESGQYAEAYSEDGVDYIITSKYVDDRKGGKGIIKTAEFFKSNKGFAAKWVESENSLIKLKGGA